MYLYAVRYSLLIKGSVEKALTFYDSIALLPHSWTEKPTAHSPLIATGVVNALQYHHKMTITHCQIGG